MEIPLERLFGILIGFFFHYNIYNKMKLAVFKINTCKYIMKLIKNDTD